MARRRLLRITMKLRAPNPTRSMLDDELAAARHAFGSGHDGWRHLERAHVLSQPWAFDHVRVHAAMLRRGWHERDRVEVRGQLLRLVVAGPGSLVNRYPIGNNGRARVSATMPMPITDHDVRAALAAAGQPVGDE
jgi:hypothetical protein